MKNISVFFFIICLLGRSWLSLVCFHYNHQVITVCQFPYRWLIQAMTLEMNYFEGNKKSIYSLSPSAIKKLLLRVLQKQPPEKDYRYASMSETFSTQSNTMLMLDSADLGSLFMWN